MVDPSSGVPLSGQNSIYTLVPSSASGPLDTAIAGTPIATAVATTVTAVAASRVNRTEVLQDQAAQQAGLDSAFYLSTLE